MEDQRLADRYVEDMGIFGDRDACTFSRGYIDQFVMVCRTCSQELSKIVSICIACALYCHVDHDLIEVGGKKKLRCDCDGDCCLLIEEEEEGKEAVPREPNTLNVYEPRHNFEGSTSIFFVFFSLTLI